MATFLVLLRKENTRSLLIEVEADDEEEAELLVSAKDDALEYEDSGWVVTVNNTVEVVWRT